MTRIRGLSLGIFFLFQALLSAKEIEMPAFAPRSPAIMGQGGSISSTAVGYEALFSNPAGFATSEREWTISPATLWINGDVEKYLVSSGLIDAPGGYAGPTTTFDDESGWSDYIESAAEDGAGYGGSFGVGFVGKGLGLGLLGVSDFLLYGSPFPSGVHGHFVSDICLIGGYAFVPVKGDFVRWSIGADIRPTIRFYAPLTAENFLGVMAARRDDSLTGTAYIAAMNGVDLYQGAGVGLDAGTRLSLGDVAFSLSIRDILDTRYSMRRYGLGDWLDELNDDRKLPDSGEDTGDEYIAPMSSVVGLAYHPDLHSFTRYIDPIFHIELDDPIDLIRGESEVVDLLHVGAEIALFRIWKIRAGFDRGNVTAGTGIRLWAFNFDVSGFTDAFGYNSEAVPRSGVSMELSFRF